MNEGEDVGIGDYSHRKIYHPYENKKNPYLSLCRFAFLDTPLTVREAEERGYRLCRKCERIMEREK